MTSHLSERFHDHERHETYLDLVQSSLDRPAGSEQASLLDRISTGEARPGRPPRVMPRISLRWLALPRLPVPFFTWSAS